MESTYRRSFRVAASALGICFALSTALWAGGSGFDDDHEHAEDEGPAFFGFVKDTRGAAVPDARVSVATQAKKAANRSAGGRSGSMGGSSAAMRSP